MFIFAAVNVEVDIHTMFNLKLSLIMKTFILALASVISLSLLTSCSDEQSVFENQNHESALVNELVALNDSLILNHFATRSGTELNINDLVPTQNSDFLSSRWISITLSDICCGLTGAEAGGELGAAIGTALGNPITGAAFGAFIGGAIVGGVASWSQWDQTRASVGTKIDNQFPTLCATALSADLSINEKAIIYKSEETKEKILIDNNLVKETSLNDLSIKVGKLHNVVLAYLKDDIDFDFSKAESNSDEIINAIITSDNFNILIEKYASNPTISLENCLTSKVINLFLYVYSNYSSDCHDVAFLINKYNEVISNSNELTSTEKDNIRIALATALCSYSYWSKEEAGCQ